MKIASIPKFVKAGPKSEDNVHLVMDLDEGVNAYFGSHKPFGNNKNATMKAMPFTPHPWVAPRLAKRLIPCHLVGSFRFCGSYIAP
jgi:hypothetical protein